MQGCEEKKFVPYDYSATIAASNSLFIRLTSYMFVGKSFFINLSLFLFRVQCLEIPNKPQYNGGIIVNPDLQNGTQGWSQFGNAKVDFRDFGGNKFVVARERNQSSDSVSQKVYLEKGILYTFSGKTKFPNYCFLDHTL